MGRIDTNASHQYQQQGLQFQELHQTPSAAETIDDAPPHEEDLYEPPPTDYQPESSAATNINNKPPPQPPQTNYPPTTPHDPQPFPPPHHHPHHHVHSFPPNQDHDHDHDKPPPPPPQPFPPPHEEQTAQTFPPIGISTSGDQYNFHQQQHPNVGMQFPAQQTNFHHHQPAAVGGIPVGFSPSPVLIPQQNQLPTQVWKTGLFECMRNPQNAIITLFFPCVTFGQIAEILDSGSTSCGTSGMLYSLIACCIAMPCIMSCTYRSKLRSKFRLIESPAPDCVVHCFCEYCALCQEYRELQERGIDPSIGWLGNVAKQQQKLQQFGMAPPMQQRMM